MKLIFFIFLIFLSEVLLSAEKNSNREVIITKKIFLHKFLTNENLTLPLKDLNLFWYSENNRLSQVNKKLEILSEIELNSSNFKYNLITDFFLKTPASGITKNLNLDSRWLEVNQKYNPILKKNDRIVFHELNNEFHIFTDNGLCKVGINNKLNIFDYLDICESNAFSYLWIIDSKGNYKKFGVSNWNYNENIPISAGSLVITDSYELKNKLLFEKIVNWISDNFDYLNINFSIINKNIKLKK